MDDSYGLAELHEHLLLIMDDIDRVCRKHDIIYTLSDGSMLGAVRHKGFIPWDDDMDVRMIRSEFERFKEVYPSEKNERFMIGHPCNLATFSVIDPHYEIPGMKKKGSSIANPWVSVFPMDNVTENEFVAKCKATLMRLLSGMLGKPLQYAVFPEKTRRLWDVTSFLGKLIGVKRVRRWYDTACISHKKETGLCSTYAFNSKGIYRRYPKSFFEDVQDIVFEDRVYKGSREYDRYMTMAYGDYMTPVKQQDRGMRHFEK